jgi:quercetin dioxygenase-like cupin family protein
VQCQNEETFDVLGGELAVGLRDRTTVAPAGSLALEPRGVVHSLANAGTTPVTLLYVITPGGWSGCTRIVTAPAS